MAIAGSRAGNIGKALGKAYENEAGSFLMGSIPNVGYPILFGENPIRAGVNGLLSQAFTTAVGRGTQKLVTKHAGEKAGDIARYVVEMPADIAGGFAIDAITSAIVPRQPAPELTQSAPQQSRYDPYTEEILRKYNSQNPIYY
jgi:hypothetical protein